MRKQIPLIILLITILYFWYKFPEENLAEKCLGFQFYIEEDGENLSYSQSYIGISQPQSVFKNWANNRSIYKSKGRTTKNKTIKERFKINVTKRIKKFTKYQSERLTIRKLLQKIFSRVKNKKKLIKNQQVKQYK